MPKEIRLKIYKVKLRLGLKLYKTVKQGKPILTVRITDKIAESLTA